MGIAMAKATFIGKHYGTGYDRNMIYLEYEYRGMRYEVYENRAKGNEPLPWQHTAAQAQIDRIIESKNIPVEPNPIDWDEIWELNGWNE